MVVMEVQAPPAHRIMDMVVEGEPQILVRPEKQTALLVQRGVREYIPQLLVQMSHTLVVGVLEYIQMEL